MRKSLFIPFVTVLSALGQTTSLPGDPVNITGHLQLLGDGPHLYIDGAQYPGLYIRLNGQTIFETFVNTGSNNDTWLGTYSPTALVFASGHQSVGRLETTGDLKLNGFIAPAAGVKFQDGTVQTTAVLAGAQGAPGIQGPVGPSGPAGPQGPPGATGQATGISLVAGKNITIQQSGNVFTISTTIPVVSCACNISCNDSTHLIGVTGPSGKATDIQMCVNTAITGCTYGYRTATCN